MNYAGLGNTEHPRYQFVNYVALAYFLTSNLDGINPENIYKLVIIYNGILLLE
jgi:hypothetical protein